MKTQLTNLINNKQSLNNLFQNNEITIEVATKNNNSLRLTLHKCEIIKGVYQFETLLSSEELIELYNAYPFNVKENNDYECDINFQTLSASFSIYDNGKAFVCGAYRTKRNITGNLECKSIESNQVVIL